MPRSNALGARICEALGLDPATTARIVITMDPLEVPTVTVTHHLTGPELADITTVLTHYRLDPADAT